MKRLAVGVTLALALVVAFVFVTRGRSGGARDEDPSTAGSSPSERLQAADAEAREASAAGAHSAVERAALIPEMRALELVLLRLPDETPIARSVVDVEPALPSAETEPWLETDGAGKLTLSVPGSALTIRLSATGFEPQDLALDPATTTYRLLLTPSNGLFGRVVRDDGEPIAGAEVRLEAVGAHVQIRRDADERAILFLPVFRRAEREETARTNERGQYYLPCRTRGITREVRVVAQFEADFTMLDVRLPREPVALDDLVLERDRGLCVRVVDTSGVPIPEARLSSPENPGVWSMDARGELRLSNWSFPSNVIVYAAGRHVLGMRAPDGTLLEPARLDGTEERVDIVMEALPTLLARVLDRDTRIPIAMAHGTAEFLVDGETRAESPLGTNSEGLASIRIAAPEEGSAEDYDLVRINVQKEGYRTDLFVEVDLPAPAEPVEFLLEPAPGALVLRGTVLRDGAPVPRCEIGLRTWVPSGDGKPKTWGYTRERSDGNGRFSIPWKPASPDEVAVLRPHQGDGEEFAMLGPFRADEVGTEDLVLDLRRGRSVPVIVHGLRPGTRYAFQVSMKQRGYKERVTTNGIDLPLVVGSELRTNLFVPSQAPSEVTLALRTSDAVYTDGSSAEYDPDHPVTPLVIEVPAPLEDPTASAAPMSLSEVRGRIEGFAPEELSSLLVSLGWLGYTKADVVEPQPDGSFALPSVHPGRWELFLLRSSARGEIQPLARLVLELEGDRDDIVLRADPRSLGEEE